MSRPYIQGLIHDSEGHAVQFLLGPDGYRQWGWTGRPGTSQAAYAGNVAILTALEEAAEKVRFFDDTEDEQAEEQQR